VHRVTDWLLEIMPQHIFWPEGEYAQRVSNGFYERAQIRGCIGAIDGSHFLIEKPVINGRIYFGRKQHYSLLLQAVCDCNMLFTNVHCGEPGSFHDCRMLRRSDLFHIAENHLHELFPNGSFLLGDKGYVGIGKKWIVTPFRDLGNLTEEQNDFNTRVSCTRDVVEQAFGILKKRFSHLKLMRHRNVDYIPLIIVACCILHNICMREGDGGDDFRDNDSDDDDDDLSDNDGDGDGRHHVFNQESRQWQLFQSMYPGAQVPR
jgi:hypothetical protein